MRALLVGPDLEYNLSIGYIAASLEQGGHLVTISTFNSREHIPAVLKAARDTDMVGLSMCFQVRASEYLELASILKTDNPDRLVIAGGHYASCEAEEILIHNPDLDLIVIHEGEHTIVEIADSEGSLKDKLPGIRGIAYRQGDGVKFTPPRPIENDLDSLPFPWRKGPVYLLAGVPTAYIIGSRGCCYSCFYCCIAALHELAPGKRFRQRSTGNISREMAMLYHERGVRQFVFHDDNFLVPSVLKNLERLRELERGIEEQGLKDIALLIKCRPGDVNFEVFKQLKRMGLLRVFLGIESSNNVILDNLGRKQTMEEAENALTICKELGISVQFTIMIYSPEATFDSIYSDIDFMERHVEYPLNFCRTEIYSGTPLERMMISEGRAEGNYLAKTYRLHDAAADLACRLTVRIFRDRCWSQASLMYKTVGIDHLSAVLNHFYKGKEVAALCEKITAWRIEVNRDTLSLLRRLVDECRRALSPSDPEFIETIEELTEQEKNSRLSFVERGRRLQEEINRLALDRIGVKPGGDAVKSRPAINKLTRHAAAVILALSISGARPFIKPLGEGNSEYAPDPLELDTDGDGLCDECELEMFGTDPNQKDTDGDETLDSLEDHDGDGITNLDEQNVIPSLHECVRMGKTDDLQYLMRAGARLDVKDEHGKTALMVASLRGSSEIAKILLEGGADPDVKDSAGRTALMIAVEINHPASVKILLEGGADTEAKDHTEMTALMIAAEKKHFEIVQIMLKAGANIDAVDNRGATALMKAAWNGDTKTVKILLNGGADPNRRDNNDSTPLMYSALRGHHEITEVLLEGGAGKSVNAVDKGGSTALIYAVRNSNYRTVQVLLEAGADVSFRDKDGNTALMISQEKGFRTIEHLLIKAGAGE